MVVATGKGGPPVCRLLQMSVNAIDDTLNSVQVVEDVAGDTLCICLPDELLSKASQIVEGTISFAAVSRRTVLSIMSCLRSAGWKIAHSAVVGQRQEVFYFEKTVAGDSNAAAAGSALATPSAQVSSSKANVVRHPIEESIDTRPRSSALSDVSDTPEPMPTTSEPSSTRGEGARTALSQRSAASARSMPSPDIIRKGSREQQGTPKGASGGGGAVNNTPQTPLSAASTGTAGTATPDQQETGSGGKDKSTKRRWGKAIVRRLSRKGASKKAVLTTSQSLPTPPSSSSSSSSKHPTSPRAKDGESALSSTATTPSTTTRESTSKSPTRLTGSRSSERLDALAAAREKHRSPPRSRPISLGAPVVRSPAGGQGPGRGNLHRRSSSSALLPQRGSASEFSFGRESTGSRDEMGLDAIRSSTSSRNNAARVAALAAELRASEVGGVPPSRASLVAAANEAAMSPGMDRASLALVGGGTTENGSGSSCVANHNSSSASSSTAGSTRSPSPRMSAAESVDATVATTTTGATTSVAATEPTAPSATDTGGPSPHIVGGAPTATPTPSKMTTTTNTTTATTNGEGRAVSPQPVVRRSSREERFFAAAREDAEAQENARFEGKTPEEIEKIKQEEKEREEHESAKTAHFQRVGASLFGRGAAKRSLRGRRGRGRAR